MDNKIKVAVLGATGSVGQKFIQLLTEHPWFELHELAASERSAGQKYGDAVNWIMSEPLDSKIAEKTIYECKPKLSSKLVFSALDSSVAGYIEEDFANAGYTVISNAKNHRQDINVPLVIPEVNPDHLDLIKSQKFDGGSIVTNPNCSTIGMVLALKPLYDAFGIEALNVVTLQAISGGGYPGIASLDILDNVTPYIKGEEDKLENEPQKLLGAFKKERIEYSKIKISAQCNRVPVIDGHTENIQIKFKDKPKTEDIIELWKSFKGEPQKLDLPSAPKQPIHYFENPFYPQPKTHRNLENGMAASVGRLRECPNFGYKFVTLSHNTVRGAAGGTILIAELMKAKGLLYEK